MPYVANGKNVMLNALAAVATHASLHNDPPGTTGTNEVTGGSPAYARQALTWGSASAGNVDLTGEENFDVPAGTTVKYVGFWSASSGGTFYGYEAVTNEVFASQGTYKVADADLTIADS